MQFLKRHSKSQMKQVLGPICVIHHQLVDICLRGCLSLTYGEKGMVGLQGPLPITWKLEKIGIKTPF